MTADNIIDELTHNSNITIKHFRCLDVVFNVTEIISVSKDILKIKGWWINISSSKPFFIDNDTINIKIEDLVNWTKYTM